MRITIIILLACLPMLSSHAQTDVEQDNMLAYMTPSKTHAFLAKYVGIWNTKLKMYIEKNSEPFMSEGTSETHMIMGGRYQLTDMEATFNGMPMLGQSLLAFDNAREQFINTWIDNFGTGIMVLRGKWHDENFTQIDLKGSMIDPESGKEVKVRQEFVFLDEDSQQMTMWTDYGEGEVKSMELYFQRVGDE